MEDKLNIDGVNHQLLDLLSSKIPGEKRRLLTGDIFKWPIYGLGLVLDLTLVVLTISLFPLIVVMF